jgi:hypothetical protein
LRCVIVGRGLAAPFFVLNVDVKFSGCDLHGPVHISHNVLRPLIQNRNNQNAIHSHLKTLGSSHRDTAMIQFQKVSLKLADRFRREQNCRAVESQVGGGAGLGFDNVPGKDSGRVVGFVAIDPDTALRVKNGSRGLLRRSLLRPWMKEARSPTASNTEGSLR